MLYDLLFKFTDWGQEKKLLGIQFQSAFWYTAFFGLIVSPVSFVAVLLINYAYLKQGLAHGANL